MARPTTYTLELGDQICELIAGGTSLVTICKRSDMPGYRTVMDWLERDEGFRTKYTRARSAFADYIAEQTLEISDDDSLDIGFDDEGKPFVKGENIQRSRLKVETRKWFAAKLLPKKYGERVQQEITPPDGQTVKFTIQVGDGGTPDA